MGSVEHKLLENVEGSVMANGLGFTCLVCWCFSYRRLIIVSSGGASLQGLEEQREREWQSTKSWSEIGCRLSKSEFYLGGEHSRLMCGNFSCSTLPSQDVTLLLWFLLTFSFLIKFQVMKTPVLPLGDKLFYSLINPTISLFLHINQNIYS